MNNNNLYLNTLVSAFSQKLVGCGKCLKLRSSDIMGFLAFWGQVLMSHFFNLVGSTEPKPPHHILTLRSTLVSLPLLMNLL